MNNNSDLKQIWEIYQAKQFLGWRVGEESWDCERRDAILLVVLQQQVFSFEKSIICTALQLMAQNQTDTGQSRQLTLIPSRSALKTVELKHSFPPNPSGTGQGETAGAATMPRFNLDLNFFTPTFVLGTDQNYYRLNEQFEHQKFIEKRRQAQIELSNSNLDIVSPNQDFCQICKETYPNYSSHILSAAHRNRLKLSRAHAYIEDLCTSVQRQHLREDKHAPKRTKPRAPVSKSQKGRRRKGNESKEAPKGGKSNWQASASLTFPTLPQKQGVQ